MSFQSGGTLPPFKLVVTPDVVTAFARRVFGPRCLSGNLILKPAYTVVVTELYSQYWNTLTVKRRRRYNALAAHEAKVLSTMDCEHRHLSFAVR